MSNNSKDTSPALPPILYKYMSQAGFLGIIESKSIWATDIFYLNDAAEYYHAVDMIRNEIDKKSKDIVIPLTGFSGAKLDAVKVVHKKDVQKHFLGVLNNMIGHLSDFHIFVCSFSEAPDLLSQWRGYCPGGSGLCVGFDSSSLVKYFKAENYRIEQCVYDFDKQKEKISDMLDQYLEDIPQVETSDTLAYMAGPQTNNFINEFFQIAPIYKDPSFSEEQEWRFISKPMPYGIPYVEYREGLSMIIPYNNVNIFRNDSNLPIKHVIIGPTPHPKLSIGSVKGLLISSGITADVSESCCPYREW